MLSRDTQFPKLFNMSTLGVDHVPYSMTCLHHGPTSFRTPPSSNFFPYMSFPPLPPTSSHFFPFSSSSDASCPPKRPSSSTSITESPTATINLDVHEVGKGGRGQRLRGRGGTRQSVAWTLSSPLSLPGVT